MLSSWYKFSYREIARRGNCPLFTYTNFVKPSMVDAHVIVNKSIKSKSFVKPPTAFLFAFISSSFFFCLFFLSTLSFLFLLLVFLPHSVVRCFQWVMYSEHLSDACKDYIWWTVGGEVSQYLTLNEFLNV